ncbi:MAG: ATP-binding protein [Taibaiella sp.]|nr:ATP-binding protein [Taibaiella sp.]
MLIRFIVKNLYSFKDQTEFNLLPGRTKRLEHHKYNKNGIEVLKQTAIYGANGSGKSNLVKAIGCLKVLMTAGRIPYAMNTQKFKLSEYTLSEPVELAIEFSCNASTYFYSVSVQNGTILEEYFGETGVNMDRMIFTRSVKNIQFFEEFEKNEKNTALKNVIEQSLLKPHLPLFFLLNDIREEAFKEIHSAFAWIATKLILMGTETNANGMFVQNIDVLDGYKPFVKDLLKSFNTGVVELKVDKTSFEEYFGENYNEEVEKIKDELISTPTSVKSLPRNGRSSEKIALVNENSKFIVKELLLLHNDENGNNVDFLVREESDGTKRLLDFIPAIHQLIKFDCTFIIDEMERSLHPTIIKELISKFSNDENTKGQLIFTTHESNLLDQEIFRTDEIWFAEKNLNGATKLYSLSDFKEHSTIDIRKGYLTGRYGAIPFLGNLHELNWHNND